MSSTRTFRVFISSTFADFQQERELLRERVWPELENFCKLRGASFDAIDLRWGIPANSAEDLDIVSICLDEVERCQKLSPCPNFISLIGNRYGWRPLATVIPESVYNLLPSVAKKLIKENYLLDKNTVPSAYIINKSLINSSDKENNLLQNIRKELDCIEHKSKEIEDYFYKSATHLEIETGIFDSSIKNLEEHFYTCFREIDDFTENFETKKLTHEEKIYFDTLPNGEYDKESGEWLEKLRQQILNKLNNKKEQIGYYNTSIEELVYKTQPDYLDKLCDDIEFWLKDKIAKELELFEKLDPLEIEQLEHKMFKEIRTSTFGGREKIVSKIVSQATKSIEHNVICIHGEGGAGKSALLAKVIDEIESLSDISSVVYRFIGASPSSVNLNSLLHGISEEIAKIHNIELNKNRATRDDQVAAFNTILTSNTKNKIYIVIDALDQLTNTENAFSLSWLPREFSHNVCLIISVLNGPIERTLKNVYPDGSYFDLSPKQTSIPKVEARKMLKALLCRKPARSLTKYQEQYILGKFETNPLVLFLKLAAENARHWRSFDTIDFIENKMLGLKTNIKEQIELLFDKLSQEDNYGPVFIEKVFSFIAISKEGISQKEIEEILWSDTEYRAEFDRRKHLNQPEVNALPRIIWSRFFFAVEPFLMERISGNTLVFNFFHRLFTEVAKSRISQERMESIHGIIANYFSNNEHQPTRFLTINGNILFNTRKIVELPYHQIASKQIDELYATLTDFEFIDSKVKIGKTYELLEDYKKAIELDLSKKYTVLNLLAKAFQVEANFIARHPESLFQSMYNRCWWHDHPTTENYYENIKSEQNLSQKNLSKLVESWSNVNSVMNPGFRWLKSLQPPPVPLDGPQKGIFMGLSSPVINVTFSANNLKILGVCNKGEIIIWDITTQNIEKFYPLEIDKSFMFKPNSKKQFNSATEIKSAEGGVLADHPGFEYWAWPGVISPDSKLVLGGSSTGDLILLRFSDKQNDTIILSPKSFRKKENLPINFPVRGLAISGNKKHGISGHADGSLFVWDLNKSNIQFEAKHKDGWINSIAVNKDCSVMVSGGGDSILYLWKKSKVSEIKFHKTEMIGHSDRIWIVALSNDGKFAASGSDDKTVRLWDLEKEKEIKCFKGHTRWIQALAFNNSSKILASSGGDGKIFLWKVRGKGLEPVNEFSGHDDSVLSLSFSNDDKSLLSGSRDQTVRIWDVSQNYSNKKIKGHSDRITCASFSKNGQQLYTGSNDNSVITWNADTGIPIDKFNVENSITALASTSNGNQMWIGCSNGIIEIRDLNRSVILKKLSAHKSIVYSIALSNDSKMAASADQEGWIYLWRLKTQELVLKYQIPNESILSIDFSPDGMTIAAGMRSGKIYLYKLKSNGTSTFILEEQNSKQICDSWIDDIMFSLDNKLIEARGGSWRNRQITIIGAETLEKVGIEKNINDGAIGSFGKYRLGFGNAEINIKNIEGKEDIAWFPKSLEFAVVHPQKRQWAGVQRYNLYHFRLEGGI